MTEGVSGLRKKTWGCHGCIQQEGLKFWSRSGPSLVQLTAQFFNSSELDTEVARHVMLYITFVHATILHQ